MQLHTNLQHPDSNLLEHTMELIGQLDALGIKPSSDEQPNDAAEDWEDVNDSDDDDDDVEMS